MPTCVGSCAAARTGRIFRDGNDRKTSRVLNVRVELIILLGIDVYGQNSSLLQRPEPKYLWYELYIMLCCCLYPKRYLTLAFIQSLQCVLSGFFSLSQNFIFGVKPDSPWQRLKRKMWFWGTGRTVWCDFLSQNSVFLHPFCSHWFLSHDVSLFCCFLHSADTRSSAFRKVQGLHMETCGFSVNERCENSGITYACCGRPSLACLRSRSAISHSQDDTLCDFHTKNLFWNSNFFQKSNIFLCTCVMNNEIKF